MWYKYLSILGGLLFLHISCFGQREVDLLWKDDTTWYVNPDYDEYANTTYRPTLIFPVKPVDFPYDRFTLDWGDGVEDTRTHIIREDQALQVDGHTYTSAGIYELKINLYKPDSDISGVPDMIYHKMMMNRDLRVSFRIYPPGTRRCMEWGGDTVSLVLTEHNNPPKTRYRLVFNSDIDDLGVEVGKAFEEKWITADSAVIICHEPTGTYGARVGVDLTFEGHGVKLNTPPALWSTFYAYRTPDLREIYHFTDSLGKGEPLENFKICSADQAPYLWLDSMKLAQYQYRTSSNPDVSPYYISVNNKLNFDVQYFWTDLIPDKNTRWVEVTTDTTFVDTTSNVRFRQSGFYKMRIVAYNECGYDPDTHGLLYIDSLWTDSLKNSPDKRYFQVYERVEEKLICRKDSMCLGGTGKLVFVDRNVRKSFDPAPAYSFVLKKGDETQEVKQVATVVFKDNTIVPDNYKKGCDSTEIYLTLPDTGKYVVTLKRHGGGACEDIQKDFEVHGGKVPVLEEEKLIGQLISLYHFRLEDEIGFQKCDTFRYELDPAIWTINHFTADSVFFYFQKDTQKDTVLNRKVNTYDFDKPGDHLNYIRTRAHNVCGWGEQKEIAFYTRVKPQLDLFRDGIKDQEGKDSLCVALNYDYELKGDIPEHSILQIEFSRKVTGDGSVIIPGTGVYTNDDFKGEKFRVLHPETGETTEKYILKNALMPACRWEAAKSLHIIEAPDNLKYKDTVWYCKGITSLETASLFETGKSSFKQGEWSWNEEVGSDVLFPQFTLSGSKDSLTYRLSNSKGCFVRGKLPFIAQEPPRLQLEETYNYCLPDTLKDYRNELYIKDFYASVSAKLTVYANAKAPGKELCSPGNECVQLPLTDLAQTSLPLFYVLENKTTEGFSAGCKVEDEVVLDLLHPVLKIGKKDTVIWPWESYSFSEVAAAVEMAEIEVATLVWKTLDGAGGTLHPGTGALTDAYYELSEDEKKREVLRFVLSARTICGKEMTDTLELVIAHEELKGYKARICSNEDYLLWEKVQSRYVDESTIEWQIVYPATGGGSLSASKGADVRYTPANPLSVADDSVEIQVTATFESSGLTTTDTIVLLIDAAPEIVAFPDTLVADDHRIDITLVNPDWVVTRQVTGIRLQSVISANNGDLTNEKTYTFIPVPQGSENQYAEVEVAMQGLPGCKSVLKKVTLLDLCEAGFNFRATPELCAGEELKLDTLYEQVNPSCFDKYTRLKWTASAGTFDADYLRYTSPQLAGKHRIKLEVSKSYETYNGVAFNEMFSTGKELEVTVHVRPDLQLGLKRDTLCRDEEALYVRRNGVRISPDFYRDSILLNGQAFRSDRVVPLGIAQGETAKLVFTVAQGRCLRWKDQAGDTLAVFRLPDMITGEFGVREVCELGNLIVDPATLQVNDLAEQVSWSSTGGDVNQLIPPVFTPDGSAEAGSITLQVTPPHGCAGESLRKDFAIWRFPRLLLEDQTVCRIVGQRVTIPVEIMKDDKMSGVRYIDWFRKGENTRLTSTTGSASFEYDLTEADSIRGEVELVAKIFAQQPCEAVYVYDTIRVGLQNPPEVLLPSAGIPELCQNDSWDLTAIEIRDASEHLWTLESGIGMLDGETYRSGENSGTARIQVVALGKEGCPNTVAAVELVVRPAPLPVGQVLSDITCQLDTVRLQAMPVAGVDAVYTWDFGDRTEPVSGEEVQHIYTQEGDYSVSLKVRYGECFRETSLPLAIHPKPRASFTLEPQVAVGQMLELQSLSQPGEVDCEWVIDGKETLTGNPAAWTFTGETAMHRVELWVKTDHRCKDSVSRHTQAVTLPVADFEVVVDSCAGVAEIVNHSERHGAEVNWDFGNGEQLTGVWDPQPQTYRRIYRDTVYQVTLHLKNASGEAFATRPVKMISRLKAGVKVFPSSDVCNKQERQVYIVSRGEADTTIIRWGDRQVERWERQQQVSGATHQYLNDTTVVKHYPLQLIEVNACESDTTDRVDVAIYPLQVKAKVLADSNYRNECIGGIRGFENKSFGFLPDGYVCEWSFDKKEEWYTDNRDKVTYRFEHAGVFQVKLRVRDNCNTAGDSVRIVVHGNDSLDFDFNKALYCTGQEVTADFVQRGKAPFNSLAWIMPDGSIQSGKQMKYTPTETGKQIFTLTAMADGCPAVYRDSVEIDLKPEPLISPVTTQGCQPFQVVFEGKNRLDQEVLYHWDFKDKTTSGASRVEKVFEEAGVYEVVLSLTSLAGCVDSVKMPVTVMRTPQVGMAIKKDRFCSGDGNILLSAQNNSKSPATSSFEWWLDGKLVSDDQDSLHLDLKQVFGNIPLTLKARDNQSGCYAETTRTVRSFRGAEAKLKVEPVIVCDGEAVTYTDESRFADWMTLELGDGSFGEGGTADHIYEGPGVYEMKLKVGNEGGCMDSVRMKVQVLPLPEAAFTWNADYAVTGLPDSLRLERRPNGGIRFGNYSSYDAPEGMDDRLTYSWNFGDATATTMEKNPVHLYTDNGTYEVVLKVKNAQGCADSISDIIYISVLKGLFVPNAFAPATADEGVNRFQPKGVGLYRYKICIYDNWGTCVWSSEKLTDGRPDEWWDGTYKGQPLPKGVYKWKAEALFMDGTVWEEKQGKVILIR